MVGWLIALAVLVLLACLPLGVSALYDGNGPQVLLIAGPVRLTLYPRKKKDKTQKKSKSPQGKTASKNAPASKGGSYEDFIPLVKKVLAFLEDLHRKWKVKRLDLKIIMAGGDPAALAINYGRTCAAVGGLVALLENHFVIVKRNVEVEVDFTAPKTLATARVDLTVSLGRLLGLTVRHGKQVLREYFNIINQRKGGAST